MKITDLHLLEIDVFKNQELIYNGMTEDIPDDLKDVKIKITGIDGKKLKIEIE